jgi:hypothetical protein
MIVIFGTEQIMRADLCCNGNEPLEGHKRQIKIPCRILGSNDYRIVRRNMYLAGEL